MLIAMRQDEVLSYLHTDHLGSTVLVTNGQSKQSDQRYDLTPFVPLPHGPSPLVDPLMDGGRGKQGRCPFS